MTIATFAFVLTALVVQPGRCAVNRFIGEEGDPKEIVSQGTGIDRRVPTLRKPKLKPAVKVDPDTGEVKERS